MMQKNLFLFFAIAVILIASPLALNDALADKNDDKKSKDHKGKDNKNENNPFQALWDAIDDLTAQIAALQVLFPQSCPTGEVSTGFDSDGHIVCVSSQAGFRDIQSKIDAKNAQIANLESQISSDESDLASLQNQLDALALTNQQILQCQQNCAALEALTNHQLQQCLAAAQSTGADPSVACASEQAAVDNFSCTCETTSDPALAAQLQEQIDAINADLDDLNGQLDKVNFDLDVLTTIQNEFG